MTMTTTQGILTIAAVVLGTMVTRFLPFFIFPEGKEPPEFLAIALSYSFTDGKRAYCSVSVNLPRIH